MSFPTHFFQTKAPIQQREENDNLSQGEIAIYQGRKFNHPSHAFIQELVPKLSFTNKMFLNIGRILEVDMSRVFAFLPRGFTKMLERIDDMFQAIEQSANPPQAMFGCFAKKRLTLQEEIAQEKEKDKNQLILYGQAEELIYQFGVQRQQQLLLAGVYSSKEFEEKQKKIAEYRALAEERYLQDPSHIEMRKKIDRNIILSYKGNLNQQEEAIIEEYWNYVTTTPEGYIKMAQVEARSIELFGASLFDKLDSIMEKMQLSVPEEKLKPSQYMTKVFNQFAFNTYQQLKEKKSQCESMEEKLLMEYLMLKNVPLMSTVIKMQLRQHLTSQLAAAEQEAEEIWVKFVKEQQQLDIDLYQKQIDFCKEIEDEVLAKKLLEFHQSELKKVLMQQTDIAYIKNRAYTIMENYGIENPDEIQSRIPVETYFDRQVIEFVNLEQGTSSQVDGLNTSQFSVLSDMQLDLAKLEDPVEYFYQEIIKADQKKLKIFEPKIVTLENNLHEIF